jgi:hypothetical protein
MKKIQTLILCAIFSSIFYACSSSNEENSATIQNIASINANDEILKAEEKQDDSKLPKTKKAKISIEGMEEEITVNLYESGASFPIPFYVYVPAKYKPSQEKTGDYETVVFASGPAKLKIISLPANMSEDNAKEIAKNLVKARGNMKRNETEEERIYYLADEDKEIYTTELRNLDNRYFIIAHEIPVDYVDGFYPRAELISENIVWKK